MKLMSGAGLWLVVLLLTACGDPALTPGGSPEPEAGPEAEGEPAGEPEGSQCPGEESADGVCLPLSPQPAPPEACAPDARTPEGVCLPELPRLTPDEACPSGERSDEGICLPTPPRFQDWPCPPGWVAEPGLVDRAGEAISDLPPGVEPFEICRPPAMPEDCPAGFMPRPGFAQCVRQGVECPEQGQGWHDEATLRARAEGFVGVRGRVLYVSPSGSDAAAGSREAPLLTVPRALALAINGDVVALSMGTFESSFFLTRGVALLGACVEGTRLEADASEIDWHLIGQSAQPALIADATFSGRLQGLAFTQGRFELRALRVEQVRNIGIISQGAELVAADAVVVTDVSQQPGSAPGMCAVAGGSPVELRRSWLSRCPRGAVADAMGGMLIEDALIAPTVAAADPRLVSGGLLAQFGGQLVARRSVVDRAREAGVRVFEESKVEVEDVWVVNTSSGAGVGVSVVSGEFEARRLGLEANVSRQVLCEASGSLDLEDVWIARAVSGPLGSGGLQLQEECEGRARRVVSVGDKLGVSVIDSAQLDVEDVWVGSSPVEEPSGGLTVGIGLFGGRLSVARVALYDRVNFGATNIQGEGDLEMEDVWIGPTRLEEASLLGFLSAGVLQSNEAVTTLRRLQGRGIIGNGASLSRGSMTLEDVQFDDIKALVGELRPGTGIGVVVEGGEMTLRRVSIKGVERLGVAVFNPMASARLEDLSVAQTAPQDNTEGVVGVGIVVSQEGQVSMARVYIKDSLVTGIYVEKGASIEASDVTVRRVRRQGLEASALDGTGLLLGASTNIRRLEVDDTEGIGVMAGGIGVQVAIEDALIHRMRNLGPGAIAIQANLGVQLDLSRVVIQDVTQGIFVIWGLPEDLGEGEEPGDDRIRVSAQDLWIHDLTSTESNSFPSMGVFAYGEGALLEMERALMERVVGVGVMTSSTESGIGPMLTLTDLTVRGLSEDVGKPWFGLGVNAVAGASITMRRALLEDIDHVALTVSSASLDSEDLTIKDAHTVQCRSGCEISGGFGLSLDDSDATMSRFSISGGTQVGLLSRGKGKRQRFSDGVLFGNRIGANFFDSDVDLDEDFDNVRTFDNERDFLSDDIKPPSIFDQGYVDDVQPAEPLP